MSGGAALGEVAARSPRVLVVDGETAHDVFEVLGITDSVARVRSPLMFEIGEELSVRVEQDGVTTEMIARVVTELELSEPG